MRKYDMIVIGGGSGGLVAAAEAAGLGAKTALIEKGKLGGDGLWSGCLPSKSLMRSAKILDASRKAEELGNKTTGKLRWESVQNRINRSIRGMSLQNDPDRFRELGVDVYHGAGHFQSPHEIRVGGIEVIHGKRIVIATGSYPVVPPVTGLTEENFLTVETAWQLEELPDSLLVIGGSPIDLELAQAFARLGSRVTVVETEPEILSQEDSELIPFIRRALKREGIRMITGARVVEVQAEEEKKRAVVKQGEKTFSLTVDGILAAAERKPNTDRLQLDRAGLRTEDGVISVNPRLQTSVPHIFAIGDVNGGAPFTHAAQTEGKAAVYNALLGLRGQVDDTDLPRVLFTDPEVFHLGWTEEEAREKAGEIRVFKTRLNQVDRFVTDRETEGLVKVITDRRGKILGAHAVGPDAGDWMQEAVFAKRHGHKFGDISRTVHPYPTRAGALQRLADLHRRETLSSSKGLSRLSRWLIRRLR
ncbi:dihydrolipoyl dehydrogenase family protein [Paludifilum halophilum]|uniref:Pyridine nucleotide-disulfide oxidoreductase n=1 Tax=Paludifilum halophilum TaxID=1642702 RepID=A0A235BAK2_9BACL|nr:FAD-dependent oxidoreductase [Paludifilum halophilum]OYD09019.1 hypothetical protein CHM34_04390 [Paludifilum halophilum]